MRGITISIKGVDLSEIYSENVAAKVFQVAQRGWKQNARAHITILDWEGFLLTGNRRLCRHTHTLYPK